MSTLRKSEMAGLAVALAGHVALVWVLAMAHAHPPVPPSRMTVTLSDDVGLQSTSPSKEQAAPDLAPQLGEAQPEEQSAPPRPEPVRPVPVPQPRPEPVKPRPEPVKPQPVARPEPKPQPKPPVHKPEPSKQAPKDDPVGRAIAAREGHAATKGVKEAKPTTKHAGGSRLGADFLKGLSAQGAGKAQTPPGQVAGPAVRASLAGAIARALKPNWFVPQGVDTDQLVTVLSFDLNRDGSLAGPIRVVTQSGITDSNRAQAHIHAENAIRAVKLAAPFALPPEYYDAWKHVAAFRFDRNLAR
ncbi:MAG: hypothetical protein KGJ57_09015 [Sphingomonadales bacterium]|nr:hypothetical protein [Sphingomonadales bacterium]MDE2169551.1 hypothetical protein [Sphingomonadales bacterium]